MLVLFGLSFPQLFVKQLPGIRHSCKKPSAIDKDSGVPTQIKDFIGMHVIINGSN